MSSISTPLSAEVALSPPRKAGLISAYLTLTKARLSALVLLTTAVGFLLGTDGAIRWQTMLWAMLGTALAAGCASSLNQVLEVDRDRRMLRTQSRPLPSNVMSVLHGLTAAIMMGLSGLIALAYFVNVIASALALLTIVLYVLAYTPLKVRTTLNTFVGAVCGAIPPMIGWVATSGKLDAGAWGLAAILFVWQIPHFLALAWLYREDYQRGGFAMLPAIDHSWQLTCRVIVLTSAAMLPVALLMTLFGVCGWWYAAGSMLIGVWMLGLALRLYLHRTNENARAMFFASIIYLPVVMSLMVIDVI
jgi:heme o synthase